MYRLGRDNTDGGASPAHDNISDSDKKAPAVAAAAAAASDSSDEDDDLETPLFRSVAAVQPHFSAAAYNINSGNSFGSKTPFGGFGGFSGGAFSLQQQKKAPPTLGGFGGGLSPVGTYGQFGGSIRSSFQFTGAAYKPNASPSSPESGEEALKKWKALAQDQIYALPCYYPQCERRSATTKLTVEDLLDRLFSCFKKLSIQAKHESSFATFGLVLRTSDQSELSLLVWYANKDRTKLYVEVDKRQAGNGCGGSASPFKSIARILKVIKSTQEELAMSSCDNSVASNISDSVCPTLPASLSNEALHKMNIVVGECAPQSPLREEATEDTKMPATTAAPLMPSFSCVGDQTLSSMEMAWGLLKKPVTWTHGLELLDTVTDPDKSGIESSKVASKAILMGVPPSPHGNDCCLGIHKKLVSLMQSLVSDSMDEEGSDDAEVNTEHLSDYQKDCLLQLVLTCLVNAMEVHVKFGKDAMSMDMGMMMPQGSSVMSKFLESTRNVVACDIIETLMDIVRLANSKPHHAYLAVKALFLLSSENSTMLQSVSLAMARDDSERVALKEAHEVGVQTHGLLEAECERLQRLLATRH